MRQKLRHVTTILYVTLPLSLTIGCDDRVIQVAREAANRQAQQNMAMAELNKEVAAGSHQLVEADAEARKGIVGVHRDLQAERSRLDVGWSTLENERRQIAKQRRTESMLVSLSQVVGVVALTSTLLCFCRYVLVAARRDDVVPELSDLLVRELLSDVSQLEGSVGPPLLSKSNASSLSEGTASPST